MIATRKRVLVCSVLLWLGWGTVALGGFGPSEFSVSIGGETFIFESRPELGYLVQSHPGVAALEVIEPVLPDPPPEGVRPVRGRGHRDLVVVHAQRPAPENEETMEKLLTGGQAAYVAPLFSVGGQSVGIAPEIIARRADGVLPEEFQSLCQSLGLVINQQLEFTDSEYLLEVSAPEPGAVFGAVEHLRESALVEWAVPNIAFQPRSRGMVVPDDPYFPNQWHLENIGQSGGTAGADIRATEAWEITTGSPRITVAVIDNGVDLDHPDLIDNLVPGYDFYDDDYDPSAGTDDPAEAHGTACAGLIAARGDNSIGVAGVAWRCRIMPIRISGGEDAYITEAEIATAIRWAAANGADVLNNSWGWELATDAVHSAIVDVTKRGGIGRDGKGCVVLWAGGNTGADIPSRDPAAFVEVVAVGAVDHNDMLWDYSPFGSELDLVAPTGEAATWGSSLDLWTTDVTSVPGYSLHNSRTYVGRDYTDQMGGTSGASPVAAGVAALILSVNPLLTGAQAKQVLERSALDLGFPGRDNKYGHGRVDARAAVETALTTKVDLNFDSKVDFRDFALMGSSWSGDSLQGDVIPVERPDGDVDAQDLAALGEFWLTSFGRPSNVPATP